MFASLNAAGIYLCNEKITDFIPFSSSEKFLELKRGEKIPEITEIIKKYGEITFEQEDIAALFDASHQFPNPAGDYLRSHAFELAETHNINIKERLHQLSLVLTREGIKNLLKKKIS